MSLPSDDYQHDEALDVDEVDLVDIPEPVFVEVQDDEAPQ